MAHWDVIHSMLTGCLALALVLSVAALTLALRRWRTPRALLAAMEDYEHDIQSIRSSLKRLNARVGMREARDKRNDTADNGANGDDHDDWAQKPGETAEQWKARMRRGPLRRGSRPG